MTGSKLLLVSFKSKSYLATVIIFIRFVGNYRSSATELAKLNDDSGYGSPSTKRARIEADLQGASLPLINELEAGYSLIYLAKNDSLESSHLGGYYPPIMDSPLRVVQALNVSPNFTGGLRDQIQRMGNFRRMPQPVIEIDLTQE